MKLPKKDVTQFIQEGGTTPAKAAVSTELVSEEKEISGFSLRLYTSKLRELTEARDARRTQAKANKQPNVSAISVHSLILEAIENFLKQEAKRNAAGGTTKPTTRRIIDNTK
jgi:hypothetical protein